MVVVGLYLPHMCQQRHQVAVVGDVEAALFADGLVVEAARHVELGRHLAGGHIHALDPGGRHILAPGERIHDAEGVAHAGHIRRGGGDALVEPCFQRRVLRQGVQPRRQENAQLRDRKLIERELQYLFYVFLPELQAGDCQAGDAVFLRQLRSQLLRLLALRRGAVQQQYKGLADGAQFAYHALLGLHIVLARYAADAAVRRHHDAQRGVVVDDPPRALLRGL